MIAFYLATPDGLGPSRNLTTTETLIMWGMVIFAFVVLPRLLFFFVGRSARQSSLIETTPANDAAPTSIDDDWFDIAQQIKRERDR
jgi:hypothetical protein